MLVGQNKLLSAKAKNPYAAYSSSCDMCKAKTEQGRKYCQRCAYQKNGELRPLSSFSEELACWSHHFY
jgi:predicted amidophosphoribosyltransferase